MLQQAGSKRMATSHRLSVARAGMGIGSEVRWAEGVCWPVCEGPEIATPPASRAADQGWSLPCARTLMNLAAAQPAVGIRRVPERSGRAQSAGIRVRGCVLVRWDGLVGMDLVRHAGICGDGHSKCHGQVLPGTGAGVRRPR